MGKKRVMTPVKEVDVSAVKYQPQVIKAPHITGFLLKLFVWLIELPILGSIVIAVMKRFNDNFKEVLRNMVIPEKPMFRPEFPPQESESGVVVLDEDGDPPVRLESALECLSPYDPSQHWMLCALSNHNNQTVENP